MYITIDTFKLSLVKKGDLWIPIPMFVWNVHESIEFLWNGL